MSGREEGERETRVGAKRKYRVKERKRMGEVGTGKQGRKCFVYAHTRTSRTHHTARQCAAHRSIEIR